MDRVMAEVKGLAGVADVLDPLPASVGSLPVMLSVDCEVSEDTLALLAEQLHARLDAKCARPELASPVIAAMGVLEASHFKVPGPGEVLLVTMDPDWEFSVNELAEVTDLFESVVGEGKVIVSAEMIDDVQTVAERV